MLMKTIEPAQEAVRNDLLCPLIDLLAKESFQNGPFLAYICPLLTYSITQCKADSDPFLDSH